MALTDKLFAIGDAIREKTGKNDLLALDQMPNEIRNIGGGGGTDIEPIVLTGDQSYGCVGYLAGECIKRYGNTISTVDITNANQLFYMTSAKSIPFSINFKPDENVNLFQMFCSAKQLETLPVINHAKPYSMASFCRECINLREIPENLIDNWDLEYCHNNTSNDMSQMFYNCASLRKIPSSVLKQLYHKKSTYNSNSMYYQTFYACYNLDEIRDLNISIGPYTSNMLSGIVGYTNCLKSFTFAMNDDGTPKIAEWKNQVLIFVTTWAICEIQ